MGSEKGEEGIRGPAPQSAGVLHYQSLKLELELVSKVDPESKLDEIPESNEQPESIVLPES